MIVKVKIEKEIDTEKVVNNINELAETLDTGDAVLLQDAVVLIKELVTKLSLTKEALDKANRSEIIAEPISRRPSCFGKYVKKEPAEDYYSACRMFCEFEEECKKETEERNRRKRKDKKNEKQKIGCVPIENLPLCFGSYKSDHSSIVRNGCDECENVALCKDRTVKWRNGEHRGE